jgi:hypothetical protein
MPHHFIVFDLPHPHISWDLPSAKVSQTRIIESIRWALADKIEESGTSWVIESS